jgi:hypothetical protein
MRIASDSIKLTKAEAMKLKAQIAKLKHGDLREIHHAVRNEK